MNLHVDSVADQANAGRYVPKMRHFEADRTIPYGLLLGLGAVVRRIFTDFPLHLLSGPQLALPTDLLVFQRIDLRVHELCRLRVDGVRSRLVTCNHVGVGGGRNSPLQVGVTDQAGKLSGALAKFTQIACEAPEVESGSILRRIVRSLVRTSHF